MAIASTYGFDMAVHEIISHAASKATDRNLNGQQLRSYVTDLNLLLRELVSKGRPLSLVERQSVTTSIGQRTYDLSANVQDINAIVISETSVSGSPNLALERYSMAEFLRIPTQTKSSRPTVYSTERHYDGVNLWVWPKPDKVYSIDFYALTRPPDVIKYSDTLKIDEDYLPAIIYGLAYHIGIDQEIPLEKLALLKKEYDEKLLVVQKDDRERVSYTFRPGRR